MTAPTFIKVDKATFLRFAAANDEGRYELEHGRIVQQMTGGTQRHGRLAGRFYAYGRFDATFEHGHPGARVGLGAEDRSAMPTCCWSRHPSQPTAS
jgi:hypothetical protein